jgi:hypothetical protein
MKYLLTTVSAIVLSSCAGDPGHFDGGEGHRRGSGNAQLRGPSAGDVIRDTHYDRARQNYEDRSHQRRYGRYD